ncbi:hypothetical protein MNBD_NITROSPINAE02-1783 [hydrothermal vent metagenome]|uniref:Glycosyltransferase 2-like domain-containing protein n=1 Tax=hydrothermal vent metagenome TaxID=652676 RepID=A0A3B1CM83_9ZZZZ
MEKKPLVTVLLPAYNAGKYIKTSIKSILSQTYENFELLIMNDGSDDETERIVGAFHDSRIRYVRNETNQGLVWALNRGLALAKGDLVARQDADDISYPERLAKQVSYMVENEETVLLGAQGVVVDEDGQNVNVGFYDKPETQAGIRWRLCFDNAFIHTSVMFRKKVILDEFKGYREFTSLKSRSPAQDFELWSRIAKDRKVANLPDVLVKCREHAQSVSSSLSGEKGRIAEEGNFEIIESNVKNVFGFDTYSDDQIKLISQLRYSIAGDDYVKALTLLDNMVSKYIARFPEAKGDAEFAEGVAMQLANMAYSYLGKNNLAAIRVYTRSARYRPGLMFRWPWAKIVILLFFGEGFRKIYRRWKK